MASIYNSGMDNARRTHENAVKRMERWTLSEQFKTETATALETSLSLMDNSFASFTEEHQKLVVTLRDPGEFQLEDKFFGHLQELYRLAVIRFRSQLDHLVREQALRANRTRDTRENVAEQTIEPNAQLTEQQRQRERERKQRQQQQYERAQRHPRTVQLNDAVIYEQCNREWINQLPAENPETDLESERRRIKKELEKLDRKQKKLDERAQQVTPVNHRKRNRSPVAQFRISSSSAQKPQRGISHPSSSVGSANTQRLTENRRNVNLYREQDDGVRSVVIEAEPADLRNRIDSMPMRRCHFCGENHKMYKCKRFLNLRRGEREQHVAGLKLCKNCFMPLVDGRHRCRFGRCDNCGIGQFHNSLLCPARYPE